MVERVSYAEILQNDHFMVAFTLEPSKYLGTLMPIRFKIDVFTKCARTRQEVSTVYFAGNGAE